MQQWANMAINYLEMQ